MNASRLRRIVRGFSLLELVIAVAIFAVISAVAYGGLSAIARSRAALAAEQTRFAQVQRALGVLGGDLAQAVSRSVRGESGAELPALQGRADAIEFTRVGFANPLAEARSNLQRVMFSLDAGSLREGRYAVLDRVPGTRPDWRELLPGAGSLRLRYLGCDRVWRESWPPGEVLSCQADVAASAQLPRAVEVRIAPAELGEIRRVIELAEPAPCRVDGSRRPC